MAQKKIIYYARMLRKIQGLQFKALLSSPYESVSKPLNFCCYVQRTFRERGRLAALSPSGGAFLKIFEQFCDIFCILWNAQQYIMRQIISKHGFYQCEHQNNGKNENGNICERCIINNSNSTRGCLIHPLTVLFLNLPLYT